MSFYLQMLREEEEFMGNTGFDNDMIADPNGKDKYEVDLQDVASVIDDINADYVDQSSQEELDGQDLQEDPVAECAIALFECEHNWNVIMQHVAKKEILEAAKGREMVMEAVDVKGFFEKAKEFFVKMFKKITAIVKNWIDNAMATFRTNKSFIAKYESKLEDGMKAYNKDSNNKKFKGYEFPGIDSSIADFVKKQEEANTAAETKARDILNKVSSDAKGAAVDAAGLSADADKFRGALCGLSTGVGAGEFRDALKKAYFGSVEKKTLGESHTKKSYIADVLKRDSKDIKNIKKAYASMKKGFDKVLKILKDLERAMYKSDSSDERTNGMNSVTKYINAQKEMKSAGSTSLAMLMKAIRAEKAQARKIANAYIYALNKGTRKDAIAKADGKPVGESAGFFGSLELL